MAIQDYNLLFGGGKSSSKNNLLGLLQGASYSAYAANSAPTEYDKDIVAKMKKMQEKEKAPVFDDSPYGQFAQTAYEDKQAALYNKLKVERDTKKVNDQKALKAEEEKAKNRNPLGFAKGGLGAILGVLSETVAPQLKQAKIKDQAVQSGKAGVEGVLGGVKKGVGEFLPNLAAGTFQFLNDPLGRQRIVSDNAEADARRKLGTSLTNTEAQNKAAIAKNAPSAEKIKQIKDKKSFDDFLYDAGTGIFGRLMFATGGGAPVAAKAAQTGTLAYFTGKQVLDTPEQVKQIIAAPTIQDKVAGATSLILSYGLLALGAKHEVNNIKQIPKTKLMPGEDVTVPNATAKDWAVTGNTKIDPATAKILETVRNENPKLFARDVMKGMDIRGKGLPVEVPTVYGKIVSFINDKLRRGEQLTKAEAAVAADVGANPTKYTPDLTPDILDLAKRRVDEGLKTFTPPVEAGIPAAAPAMGDMVQVDQPVRSPMVDISQGINSPMPPPAPAPITTSVENGIVPPQSQEVQPSILAPQSEPLNGIAPELKDVAATAQQFKTAPEFVIAFNKALKQAEMSNPQTYRRMLDTFSKIGDLEQFYYQATGQAPATVEAVPTEAPKPRASKPTKKPQPLTYKTPKLPTEVKAMPLNPTDQQKAGGIVARYASDLERMKQDVGGVSVNMELNRRESTNPEWYREFYAKNKRTPTKQDYLDIAHDRLVRNKADQEFDPKEAKQYQDIVGKHLYDTSNIDLGDIPFSRRTESPDYRAGFVNDKDFAENNFKVNTAEIQEYANKLLGENAPTIVNQIDAYLRAPGVHAYALRGLLNFADKTSPEVINHELAHHMIEMLATPQDRIAIYNYGSGLSNKIADGLYDWLKGRNFQGTDKPIPPAEITAWMKKNGATAAELDTVTSALEVLDLKEMTPRNVRKELMSWRAEQVADKMTEFLSNTKQGFGDNATRLQKLFAKIKERLRAMFGKESKLRGALDTLVKNAEKRVPRQDRSTWLTESNNKEGVHQFIKDSTFENPANGKKLVAVHNLNAEQLAKSLEYGGLAMPSLAIIDPKIQPFSNYGDVTLVASKDAIDPSKSARNKVFAADAYSPTYPTVYYELDTKGISELTDKMAKELGDKATPEELRKTKYMLDQYERPNDAIMQLRHMDLVEKYFIEKTGIDPTKSEGRNQFEEWVAKELKPYIKSEKFWVGHTPSGNSKYLPATAENALKVMRKEGVRAAASGGGFGAGLGEIRSTITPQLKSMKQIRETAKTKLVGDEEFKKLAEEHEQRIMGIQEQLDKYVAHRSDNQFTEYNSQMEAIKEYVAGDREWFDQKFKDAPKEITDKLDQLRKDLVEMPTTYFEAKLDRVVGASDFTSAIVPENTNPELIKTLEKEGLAVIKYDPAVEGARNQVLKDLASGDSESPYFARGGEPKKASTYKPLDLANPTNSTQTDHDIILMENPSESPKAVIENYDGLSEIRNQKDDTKVKNIFSGIEKKEDKQLFEAFMDYQEGATEAESMAAFDKLPQELKDVAIKVTRLFDDLGQKALMEKRINNLTENYITQIWDEKSIEELVKNGYSKAEGLNEEQLAYLKNFVSQNTRFGLERVIQSYKAGIKLGLKPKYETLSGVLRAYMRADTKAQVGNYMAQDLINLGVNYIQPSSPALPVGWRGINKISNLRGYSVSPETHKAIRGIESASRVAESKFFSSVLKASQAHKQIQLAGDLFLAMNYVRDSFKPSILGAPRLFWEARKMTQAERADLVALGGLKMEGEYNPETGKISGKGRLGKAGELLLDEKKNPYFWADYISFKLGDQLRNGTARMLYRQNLKTMGRAEAAQKAVRFAQDAFGRQNLMRLGRDQTFQDLARLGMISPDYTESRTKFILKGLKGAAPKVSRTKNAETGKTSYKWEGWSRENLRYTAGLARYVAMAYATLYLLNQAFSGHAPWENDPDHKWDLEIPIGGGKKYYVSVLGVVKTDIRFLTGIANLARGDGSDLGRWLGNKSSVPLRIAEAFMTNKDWRGEDIVSPTDSASEAMQKRATNFLQTTIPLPFQGLVPGNYNNPNGTAPKGVTNVYMNALGFTLYDAKTMPTEVRTKLDDLESLKSNTTMNVYSLVRQGKDAEAAKAIDAFNKKLDAQGKSLSTITGISAGDKESLKMLGETGAIDKEAVLEKANEKKTAEPNANPITTKIDYGVGGVTIAPNASSSGSSDSTSSSSSSSGSSGRRSSGLRRASSGRRRTRRTRISSRPRSLRRGRKVTFKKVSVRKPRLKSVRSKIY